MKMRTWSLAFALLTLQPTAYAEQDENSDSSLLWGTYRPNLYFGLRPRLPQSLMTGLMWHGLNDFQSFTRKPEASYVYISRRPQQYLQTRVTRVSKGTSCKDILGRSTIYAMEASRCLMTRRIMYRSLQNG